MSRIIRSKRNTPFVQIDKTGPEDPNLSWKAKGILSYILCKPDDWQIYVAELSKHAKDGKDATASGVNELIKAGYITRKQKHSGDGKFAGYDYEVVENPIDATVSGKSRHGKRTVSGKSVNGSSVNGKTENGKPETTNNDLTNNDLTKERKNESERENQPKEEIEETPLPAKASQPSKKVAPKKVSKPGPVDDSFLTEEIPDLGQKHWTEVARAMAAYFKDENGFGPEEWRMMCDSAGGHVKPLVITTLWAGKAKPFELVNWRNHTGKLTNWIRNNITADRTTEAKVKSMDKNKIPERLKVNDQGYHREIKVSRAPTS